MGVDPCSLSVLLFPPSPLISINLKPLVAEHQANTGMDVLSRPHPQVGTISLIFCPSVAVVWLFLTWLTPCSAPPNYPCLLRSVRGSGQSASLRSPFFPSLSGAHMNFGGRQNKKKNFRYKGKWNECSAA